MIRSLRFLALAGLAAWLPTGPVSAQEQSVEARIWLDRGNEAVLNRGDRVRVYYRTSADAFVAIFHVDTNGGVQLLYPSSPEVDPYVPGGRDYRLLFPRSSQWYVDEDPGMGYFFIVASPEPMDFRDFRYSYQSGGWDLSFVGRTVYDDPYVAMDEYVARLIPDWEYADYALDFLEYDVGERHDYPRFVCYDCHGFTPYSTWNPYLSACTSFRVVVYNDPWYYPVNRYQGTRVVWVRPPLPGQPRYVFRERRPGEPSAPITMPRPSVGDRPGIPGDAVQRRSGAGIGSGGRPAVGGRTGPVPRRPGASDPRSRPTATPTPSTRTGGSSRPVLERRTGSGSGGRATPPVRSRPSGGVTSPPRSSTSGGSGVEQVRGRPGSTGSVRRPGSTGGTTGSVRRPSEGVGPGTIRVVPRSGASGSVRPPGNAGSATPTRPTGAATPSTRPGPSGSARPSTRGGASGAVRPPPRSGGGTATQRAPTTRGGATARPSGGSRPTGATARPTAGARSSGSSARPSVGTRSSGATVRPPPRSGTSGTSGAARRPAVRPGSSSGARPRSSGSVRPPARSGSSGAVRKPVVRPRGSSGSGSSASRPARVRPKPRGGGAAARV